MKYLAVDTETTGFDMFNGCKPFAITTCDEACNTEYIGIGEDDMVPVSMHLASDKVGKVFHNAKFDVLMLNTIPMNTCGEVHDTMIMAHVYNPDETNKKLKHLADKYLDEEPVDEQKLKQYMIKEKDLKNVLKLVSSLIQELYGLKK